MSLYRQLISVVSTVIFLLVSLWTVVSIHTYRSILIEQLEMQAQSGATSLAISMTEVLAKSDSSRLGVLFNAVSDLGYYQKIYFIDLDNKRLLERSFPEENPDVPDLFIRVIALPTIEAHAAVSFGWKRIGNVVVILSLRESYRQLWQASLKKAIWGLSLSLGAVLILTLIIRLRLRAAQRPKPQR